MPLPAGRLQEKYQHFGTNISSNSLKSNRHARFSRFSSGSLGNSCLCPTTRYHWKAAGQIFMSWFLQDLGVDCRHLDAFPCVSSDWFLVRRCVVPLKCCTGFNYVYKQLVLDSSFTSKFCFAEPAFHKLATYETIRNELRRTCVFRDFWRSFSPRTLKHHQKPGKIWQDFKGRNGLCPMSPDLRGICFCWIKG